MSEVSKIYIADLKCTFEIKNEQQINFMITLQINNILLLRRQV